MDTRMKDRREYASYELCEGAVEIVLYPDDGGPAAATHRVLRSVGGGEPVELAVLEKDVLWYQDKPIPDGEFAYVIKALDDSGSVIATYECREKKTVWPAPDPPGLDSAQAKALGLSSQIEPISVPAPFRYRGLEWWLRTELLALAACADEGANAYLSRAVMVGGTRIMDGSYRVETCLTRPGVDPQNPMDSGGCENDFSLSLVSTDATVAVVSGVLYVAATPSFCRLFGGVPKVETLREALDSCGPSGIALVATVAVSGIGPWTVRFSRGRSAEIWFPSARLSHLSADEHRGLLETLIGVAELVRE